MGKFHQEISMKIESQPEIDPEGIAQGVELEVKATSLMREQPQATKIHLHKMKMARTRNHHSLILRHLQFKQISMVDSCFRRRRRK